MDPLKDLAIGSVFLVKTERRMRSMESDLVLLRRFRESRDPDAFWEIVRRYTGTVFAACLRVLHDPGRAEDAAQETFYRLMTRPQKVSESLGGWLHRAATRLALDIRRSEISRQHREASYEAEHLQEPSQWTEVAPKLDEALAALPDAQRDLLVRHFLRGEAQADLAIESQTSPATLSRRIKAAVDQLRQELQRRGVCVAPSLMLITLLNCGKVAVPPALKLAMGKMALFCTARSIGGGVAAKLTLASVVKSIPRIVYSFRWGLAAAGVATIAAVLIAMWLRQVQFPTQGQADHPIVHEAIELHTDVEMR